MKGFVLTLDAVFSLIFAAMAVSTLVYVAYSDYTPTSLQLSGAASMGSALLQTNIGNLTTASLLSGAASSASWPQYGASEGYSFSSDIGPSGPYLLYSVTAAHPITPVPIVWNNEAFFEAGNQLYAINASTGTYISHYPINNSNALISSPVAYRNEIIYANSTGYIIATSTYNGLNRLWTKQISSFIGITTPMQVEDGYITFAIKNTSGYGQIYFMDPINGSVVEIDPTSYKGNGPLAFWIAHYKNEYYVGYKPTKLLNTTFRREYVNTTNSVQSSNSFTSFGLFKLINLGATGAMYKNLSAYYKKSAGSLGLISIPYYSYAYQATFNVPIATFNTTPSIGGNVVYLLSNGIAFLAYNPYKRLFNVSLPKAANYYNYSNVALAYGNAYVPDGNTLYVFGVPRQQQNDTLLGALGNLYLNGDGELADYILYNTYGKSNVGIFINGSYAPSLHVANFNGINNYILVPPRTALSPEAGINGAMSLCAWYKINSLSGYGGVLLKGTQSPSSGNVPEYTLDVGGTARGFAIYNSIGAKVANYTADSTSLPLSVGSWSFSCFTYNRTAAYYYFNATRYNATATLNSQILPTAGSGNLIFGAGTGGFSKVGIADIQIYNRSLGAGTIEQMYYQGMYAAPTNYSGLVGWWPLLGHGNDFSGNGFVGYPSNVTFIASNYIPADLSKSPYIGSDQIVGQLTSNGITSSYRLGVVTWTS